MTTPRTGRRMALTLLGLTASAALIVLLAFQWQFFTSDPEPYAAASTPGRIDVGFVQTMTVHHRQAILMSQLMLDGRETAVSSLARRIANTQLYEVGQMEGWLRLWQESLHPRPLRMGWMLLGDTPLDTETEQYLLDCEQSPTGMPGLATLQQLETLRASRGLAGDRRFLQMMLDHHQGGIPMARFAARHAHLKVVRDLAAQIVLEQSREIDLISRMLFALPREESTNVAD